MKNPRSGIIVADHVGEVIRGDAVMECTGEVRIRAAQINNKCQEGRLEYGSE